MNREFVVDPQLGNLWLQHRRPEAAAFFALLDWWQWVVLGEREAVLRACEAVSGETDENHAKADGFSMGAVERVVGFRISERWARQLCSDDCYDGAPLLTEEFDQEPIGSTEWRCLLEWLDNQEPLQHIVGTSPSMVLAKLRLAISARAHDPTLLLVGETGTGKEIFAREFHRMDRPDGPFVPVNVSAIPDTLIESVLFGHVKGAFTGAAKDATGLFHKADGGVLFLDEIGDLGPKGQAKILRAVAERSIRPLGAETEIPVDVHIVGATNRDLPSMVNRQEFRGDLLFRLAAESAIWLPPLRDRGREDIIALAQTFAKRRSTSRGALGAGAPTLDAAGSGSPSARAGGDTEAAARATLNARKCQAGQLGDVEPLELLEPEFWDIWNYGWPGNVRELRGIIETASRRAATCYLTYNDLADRILLWEPPDAPSAVAASSRQQLLDRLADDYIDSAERRRQPDRRKNGPTRTQNVIAHAAQDLEEAIARIGLRRYSVQKDLATVLGVPESKMSAIAHRHGLGKRTGKAGKPGKRRHRGPSAD